MKINQYGVDKRETPRKKSADVPFNFLVPNWCRDMGFCLQLDIQTNLIETQKNETTHLKRV